jgi:hypothetical protein
MCEESGNMAVGGRRAGEGLREKVWDFNTFNHHVTCVRKFCPSCTSSTYECCYTLIHLVTSTYYTCIELVYLFRNVIGKALWRNG